MGHGIDALFRLDATFFLHGVTCMQSYWFRSKPTTPSLKLQDDTDALVTEYNQYVWPQYKAFMSNEVQWIGSVAKCVEPIGVAQTVYTAVNQFGTIIGESLPSFNAGVLSLYSAYPGRSTHGRLYLPGIPEAEHQGGNLSNAQVVRMKNIADILLQHYSETGSSTKWWGGVFSRKNGAVRLPGPPPYIHYSPLAHLPWTRAVVNARVGTQRHRKPGRGM